MQPNQENPYDFILANQQQQKAPIINLQNSSGPKKVLLIIGFVLTILILLVVGFNVISSLGKANNDDLVLVQAEQTELSRILALGLVSASDQALRNQLATLQAAVATDTVQVADVLDKRSVNVTKIQLSSSKDASVDEAFAAALVNGKFDEVVLEAILNQSKAYYDALIAARSDQSGTLEPQVLATAIANVETILASE